MSAFKQMFRATMRSAMAAPLAPLAPAAPRMFGTTAMRYGRGFQPTPVNMFKSSAPRYEIMFGKAHEWIDIQGDKATLGITDFAQSELGEIVYMDLPDIGTKVVAGEPYGCIESIKTTDDVYTPVDGVVEEINTALGDEPALINSQPESAGWMVKLSGISKPTGLMNKDEYLRFVKESAA